MKKRLLTKKYKSDLDGFPELIVGDLYSLNFMGVADRIGIFVELNEYNTPIFLDRYGKRFHVDPYLWSCSTI